MAILGKMVYVYIILCSLNDGIDGRQRWHIKSSDNLAEEIKMGSISQHLFNFSLLIKTHEL